MLRAVFVEEESVVSKTIRGCAMTQENRLKVLEDIEAIKNLKASYCYLVDDGVAGDASKLDELLTHFTDDAKADFGAYGTYEGKEALARFFKEMVPGVLSYAAHMVHNPIIEVEGDGAGGRWYFEVPCTLREPNRAAWIQGRYEEEYGKVGGGWKWKSIKAIFEYFTPFDEGWAKTRMVGG